ncbi:MAG: glycosyltransferase family 39 protein [Flavobacteriales bacterium]
MKTFKLTWFFIAYAVIVVFSFFTYNSWNSFRDYPYQFKYGHDINQYYSYLPSGVIDKDFSMQKSKERGYWLVADSNGIPLQKMTLGMSILYSPFFLLGHTVALNSDYKADGYSKPYSVSLKIGTYLYVSIGLYLLYLTLLYFFRPIISAVSIVLIFLSTNLFYYTLCEGEMSHSYLFLLFAVVILNTLKWFENYQTKNLLFLGLAFGMSVLIRPTSALLFVFILLYAINKVNLVTLIKEKFRVLSLAISLFFIPLFCQMVYWKIYGGTWMRWSYGDESFYFTSPHILEFVFGYRKGWLIYTPIMIFSILGMFLLKKKVPGMKWSIPIITVLAIYILSSWWCWWFGGGFGSRSMVEYYALLIFPLAAFIDKIAKIKYLNYSFILIFGFTIFYNVLATHKKNWWELHWDSMSKESFWYTFSRMGLDGAEKKMLESLHINPDYENARKGEAERKK